MLLFKVKVYFLIEIFKKMAGYIQNINTLHHYYFSIIGTFTKINNKSLIDYKKINCLKFPSVPMFRPIDNMNKLKEQYRD